MTKELGFKNIPVRFFIYDEEASELEQEMDCGYREANEADFLEAQGVIEYKRSTVFENGVSQICLTKNPFI